jgi:hypothetical protein
MYAETSINNRHIVVCSTIYYLVMIAFRYIDNDLIPRDFSWDRANQKENFKICKSNKYQTFWSKIYKYKISVISGNILRKSSNHMSTVWCWRCLYLVQITSDPTQLFLCLLPTHACISRKEKNWYYIIMFNTWFSLGKEYEFCNLNISELLKYCWVFQGSENEHL